MQLLSILRRRATLSSLPFTTSYTALRPYRRPLLLLYSLVLSLFLYQTALAANPVPVQTYYIPLPEDQVFSVLENIFPGRNICGGGTSDVTDPIITYVSIAARTSNTIIYYDHWEDGFEDDIANPIQPTTEIWGDGNVSNGAPPNVANDQINANTVIILNNAIATGGRGTLDFDGGDKIASSKAIAATRAAWSDGPKTLFAGAVEVYDTNFWGNRYDVPVGENVSVGSQLFESSSLFIMAQEDRTVVKIDKDRDGNFDITVTLNEGESHLELGGVQAGTVVSSSAPVQTSLITGDRCDAYESRWFALFPSGFPSQLRNSYYVPVSTPANDGTIVFLYNPNSSAITVRWATKYGAQTPITIAPNSTARQAMPVDSAAHFFTDDKRTFLGVAAVDADNPNPTNINIGADWGFTLIPDDALTPQVLIGWGPGRDPTSSVSPNENGSPVWVTPVLDGGGSAKLCIDYNGDGIGAAGDYDTSITLASLENKDIFDPDGDQTGLIVYVCDDSNARLVAVWGQKPRTASASEPGLDLGTGIPPQPSFTAAKDSTLVEDVNGDGRINPGDTVEYSIIIRNNSRIPIPNVTVSDEIPQYTTYVARSTSLTVNEGTPTTVPDGGGTTFPLDESGYLIDIFRVNSVYVFKFRVTVNELPAVCVDGLLNEAVIQVNKEVLRPTVKDPVICPPSVLLQKYTNGEDADTPLGPTIIAGAPVTWTYVFTNASLALLTNVAVTDNIAGVTPVYVSGDEENVGVFDPGEVWTYQATGIAQGGQYANIGTVTADAPPIINPDGSTGDPQSVTVTDPSHYYGATPSMTITKTASATQVAAGATVTYTYAVANTGEVILANVTVTDDKCQPVAPKLSGQTNVGDTNGNNKLDLTEIWHYMCATALVEDTVNTATATAEDPLGQPVGPVEDTEAVDVLAEITLLKTADRPDVPVDGEDVTFTITVTNISISDIVTITSLNDTVFGDLTALSNTTCSLPQVLNGQASYVCQFTEFVIGTSDTLTPPVVHYNVATATGVDDDGNTVSADDDEELVVREPLLDSTKRDALAPGDGHDGIAMPRDTIQYTIIVSNTGALAKDVVFSDTVGTYTTLVTGTVTTSQGIVIEGNNPGDTGVRINIGDIPTRGVITITFDVTVDYPLPADVTQVANQGVFTGPNIPDTPTDDPDTPENDDPTITPITAKALLEVNKVDVLIEDADWNRYPSAGDTLRYVIYISNWGERAAEEVVLTDILDPFTTLINGTVETTRGTIVRGNNPGDSSILINIGTIEGAGDEVVVQFKAKVSDDLPETQCTLHNQASVTYNDENDPLRRQNRKMSDDPETPEPDDPTETPACAPTAEGNLPGEPNAELQDLDNALFLPLIER